jgi:hypothetical protein
LNSGELLEFSSPSSTTATTTSSIFSTNTSMGMSSFRLRNRPGHGGVLDPRYLPRIETRPLSDCTGFHPKQWMLNHSYALCPSSCSRSALHSSAQTCRQCFGC